MNSLLSRLAVLPLLFALVCPVLAEDPPKVFGDYLKVGVATRGEIVGVIPPKEMQKYIDIIHESAKAAPEWFEEFSKKNKPGLPLPFHEKMGLTKEDHAEYLLLWEKREMKPIPNGAVTLRLESPKEGEWVVRVDGLGSSVSLLRYDAKKDVINSPNGAMLRLVDVDAKKESLLGAWTGHEWKFDEEDLVRIKENFAIGKMGNGKLGLILYRLQEISTEGVLEYDRRMLIRFPLAVK
jgi:hypothetical protein